MMFDIDRKYTIEIVLTCASICFAAVVIGGIGIASNVIGDRAMAALVADGGKVDQGVDTRVVQVGLINGVKVTVEQSMKSTGAQQPTGLFGLSGTDWAIFAAAFCMLALAIGTFFGVRLFFSPSEW
jgi:hypothetical protein